jgi:hypothetical protein
MDIWCFLHLIKTNQNKSKLTHEEKNAIKTYATPPYGFIINNAFHLKYHELDNAIENSPVINDVTLYRGKLDNPKWKVGRIVMFPRYTSTSFVLARALFYVSDALYVFRWYNGHAAYSPNEEEFILPRKTMWVLKERHEGISVPIFTHPKNVREKNDVLYKNKITVLVFDYTCQGSGPVGNNYWKFGTRNICK